MRVLVVDDCPEVAAECHQWLSRACHVNRIAGSLELGKTLMKLNKYDAAVVDWNLSGSLGFGQGLLDDGVRVVFTGKAMGAEERAALTRAGFHFLAKPFDRESLLAKVTGMEPVR